MMENDYKDFFQLAREELGVDKEISDLYGMGDYIPCPDNDCGNYQRGIIIQQNEEIIKLLRKISGDNK